DLDDPRADRAEAEQSDPDFRHLTGPRRGRNGRSAGEVLEPAERLLDPLLVLDQREPYEALAVLAEPDARRDGHLRVLDEQFGELERAQRAERRGDRRPDEHRALGLRHRPAKLVSPSTRTS